MKHKNKFAFLVFCLGFIFCVNIFDLALTITVDSTLGAQDYNPIVDIFLQSDAYILLSIFKISFIVFALSVLYKLRETKSAQWAVWILGGLFSGLLVYWVYTIQYILSLY